MFKLTIDRETMPFADLRGAGALVVRAVEDAGRPFDPRIARGENNVLSVSFDIGPRDLLKVGGDVVVQLTAGAEVWLDVIWPDEPKDQQRLLEAYDLAFTDDERLFLAIEAKGKAELGAGAAFPAGAIATTFGVRAGGDVAFSYVRSFRREMPAGDILRQFLRGMRLPHQIQTVEDLPGEDEVIAFRYGGYLQVGAGLAWGYSVNTYHEMTPGDLKLAGRVDVASAVKVDAEIRIAAEHGIEVRRGAVPGWARVVVRKHREGAYGVAADIGIRTTLATEGLPADAGRFMEALLGLHVPDMMREVAGLLSQGPDALSERLQAEAKGLAEHYLEVLFGRWFDRAPAREEVRAFFERLQAALRAYEKLKRIDERAVAVLEHYAGDEERLRGWIAQLLALPGRAGLEAITDTAFWDFLQRYLGDRLVAFVTSEETFQAVRERLVRWKEEGWEVLLDLIAARQEALDATKLVAQLDAVLQRMDAFDTPEEVRDRAKGHLLELADRLTGRALEALAGEELRAELERLKALLDRLATFEKELYAHFEAALNRTHEANLSWSYTHAREHEALIDVEINLATAPELFRGALFGDFRSLVRVDDPARVKVHPSLFTTRLRSASRLQVDLLGWTYGGLRELVFETRETVRQQGGGLLHIYRFAADEQTTRRVRDEEVRMRFLFALMAESRVPGLVETVSRMAIDYDFDVTDPETSDRELRAYLRLAEHLRMLPEGGVGALLETFRRDLGIPDGAAWGAVKLTYRVRYDPDILLGLFRLLPKAALAGNTRQAFRNIVSASYRNFGASQHVAIATMILDDRIYRTWKTAEARLDAKRTFCYEVAGERQKVCLDWHPRSVLHVLYEVEDDLVDTLLMLDDVLDRAHETGGTPDRRDVEQAFQRFVRQRRRLEKWMTVQEADRYVNPLFAVLDYLIAVVSGGRATRAMLQLTFEGEGNAPVTRILTAAEAAA